MKKAHQLVLGGVGIIVLVLAGGAFVGKQKIEQRQSSLTTTMLNLKSSLPKDVDMQIIQSQHAFVTKGMILFIPKRTQTHISVEYEVHHNILTWFGADMDFTAHTKVTTLNENKNIEADGGYLINTTGTISENGSLHANNQYPLTTIHTMNDIDVIFKPGTGTLNYNSQSHDVDISVNYPFIGVAMQTDDTKTFKVKLDNNNFISHFNTNNLKSINNTWTTEKLNYATNNISGIRFDFKTDYINNLFNSKMDFSWKNANIQKTGKNENVEFALSFYLNGLDGDSLAKLDTLSEKYNTIFPKTREAYLTQLQKDSPKIIHLLEKIIQTGFKTGVERFYLKTNEGQINASQYFTLSPVASTNEISFYNNTKIGLNVNASGLFAQQGYAMLPQIIGANLQGPDPQKLELKANYEKGEFTLNQQPLDNALSKVITAYLHNIDTLIEETNKNNN